MIEAIQFENLTLEQILFILDILTSPYYLPMVIEELKKKLQLNKDIIDSYPLEEDRYLCFDEKRKIKMIESILKVIDNE